MGLKVGDWVNVQGHDLGPGKIWQIIGGFFRADFLVEDGVSYSLDLIPLSDIELVITDQKEIENLEKDFKWELV